jgi:hypothetical protein
VVSVTDPYGRILGSLDRYNGHGMRLKSGLGRSVEVGGKNENEKNEA